MNRTGLAGLLVIVVALQFPIRAEEAVQSSIPGETTEQYAARMKWFREARFGVFICWGPCSIAEGEIGWSRNGPRPGQKPDHATSGIPQEVYDNLYKQFNPTSYNPKEWAQIIKDSGAKYMIFLTKHHDGFCLFDTKLTDYKVTNTPYGRDVTAELAKACQEAGIRIFWYYSPPDWHHPDYRTANHARYIEYLHGEIRELCTNYGRIDGIWFDGLGGKAEDWDSPRLFKMIHELQPGVIINNRAGVRGDFDTPEQVVGSFQIERPWESCITMSVGWSWRGADKPVKSLKDCLHLLIRCAGGGGNLALDTGPMPDGQIDPRQAERYREMGAWLKKYGESIYATNGGPYRPGPWGVSTRKGNRIYLHVLETVAADNGTLLRLPPLPKKIVACSALTGGNPTFTQTAEALEVQLPAKDRDEIDTIIALDLDGPAADIKPISTMLRGSLTTGRKASASSIWNKEYSAEMAFDGDEGTRWGAAPGSRSGWLEVDLGKPMTFDRVLILENPWNRVRKFQLQYRDGSTGLTAGGEEWKTFHEGTTLGEFRMRIKPVTAQHVRLNVLDANEVPTLWEFDLFTPDKR